MYNYFNQSHSSGKQIRINFEASYNSNLSLIFARNALIWPNFEIVFGWAVFEVIEAKGGLLLTL